jgi:RsiW-degrading membrane proteinase PrsW (M82 family)
MDGIVYGVVVSFGFVIFENIFYVLSGGLGVVVLRALTVVLGYVAMGAIMGYYVVRARFGFEDSLSAMAKVYFILVVLYVVATSGTLTFTQGEASKTFKVYLYKDAVSDSGETVNLYLTAPGNAELGTPSAATLNIYD